MSFDHGSYFNFEGFIEPGDDFDQYAQDYLQGDDDSNILEDYFTFQSSDQNDKESSKNHTENHMDENQCSPFDSSQELHDTNFQNTFNDLPSNFHGPNNPLSAPDPHDLNISLQDEFIQDCYNGPPIFQEESESLSPNSLQPKLFDPNFNKSSLDYSLNTNFNKRNTSSVVPTGSDASILFQSQFNQSDSSESSSISYVPKKSVSIYNKSSFENLSNKNGNFGSNSVAIQMCQMSPSEQFDRYLKSMVLANQQDPDKNLKIIIFNFFREYLSPTHPELLEKELIPLTRNEKRIVKLIDKRILKIKSYIIENFNNNKTETLLPIVEKYNEHIVKNHKRKGKKIALQNLAKINKSKNPSL